MANNTAFSTDAIPDAERFDAWRSVNLEAVGIVIEPLHEAGTQFQGKLSSRTRGPLLSLRYEADGSHAWRGQRQIADRAWDGYLIYHEHGEGAWFDCSGREFATRPGALVITDFDQSFATRSSALFRCDAMVVPNKGPAESVSDGFGQALGSASVRARGIRGARRVLFRHFDH